jgi:tyrosinase
LIASQAIAAISVEIFVNGRSPAGMNDLTDDYVTWSPTLCEARVTGLPAGHGPFTAHIMNDPAVDQIVLASAPTDIPAQSVNNPARYAGGRVRFALEPTAGWPVNATATEESITLTLPENGDFVKFRIAGQFGRPSYNDKDVILQVHQNDSIGPVVGSHSLMVRVRKDGNRMHDFEIKRFLDAMRAYKDVTSGRSFDESARIHANSFVAGNEAHTDQLPEYQPSFLPWHRTYLLQVERDLQTINNGEFRAVTLPYWNWDEATPRLWANWYMGAPNTHPFLSARPVIFHVDNPLEGWIAPSGGPIRRRTTNIFNIANRPPSPGGGFVPALKHDPDATPSIVSRESFGFLGGVTTDLARLIEIDVHNNAHGLNCAGGQILSGDSADDPLFYLLHCQIDRQWAAWQNYRNRFGTTSDDYELGEGPAYVPGTSILQYGSHLDDEIWPWDLSNGADADPLKSRPIALGGLFAASPIRNLWPATATKPKNRDMIDFEGRVNPVLGLGFCYDDVPYLRGVADSQLGPLFDVGVVGTPTVGVAFNIRVRAVDSVGAVRTDFTGRVMLAQEGGTFGVSSPSNTGVFVNGTPQTTDDFHDFVAADAGAHNFSVVAHTSETISRFKTFALNGGLPGESRAISVSP